jgi:hypothetical protein
VFGCEEVKLHFGEVFLQEHCGKLWGGDGPGELDFVLDYHFYHAN